MCVWALSGVRFVTTFGDRMRYELHAGNLAIKYQVSRTSCFYGNDLHQAKLNVRGILIIISLVLGPFSQVSNVQYSWKQGLGHEATLCSISFMHYTNHQLIIVGGSSSLPGLIQATRHCSFAANCYSHLTILYLGRESFIDLIIEGGPEILIDNINCTGGEQNLTECIFDPDASDCLGNFTHRVGVRCHEESMIFCVDMQ